MRVRKSALLEFIRSQESVTFPEIEKFFQEKRYDYQGCTAIKISGDILWHGWSHKAGVSFLELYEAGKIDLVNDEGAPIPPPRLRFAEGPPDYPFRQVLIKAR